MEVVHIAIRAKRYDEYVIEFLKSSPDGVVVNIRCGIDSCFSRIDNGRVCFHDLDLPEVVELKRRFFEVTDRYHFIPSSVLDCYSIWCWQSHSTGVLYWMSFDLSNMERGAFCHDRCVCLLLAEYMQDVGAAKPNAEKAMYEIGTYSRFGGLQIGR